mgnify:CR=1 FL=1
MSETLVLRPYQTESVEQLRSGYRDGHRAQLLVAPTGAGKTAIATHLMMQARERQTRTAFIVDRVNLVDQTSAALDRYSVPHGVVQANHWRRTHWEPIQICSAQTLEKRGFFPDLKLLIVDEAHCMRKQTTDLIRSRPDLRVLGLTATPFAAGMAELYSNIVNVTTTDALIQDGFLTPLKIYAAVKPDMTGAKVIAGEWSDKEIQERGRAIIGDIVSEWVSKTTLHFGGPVKTIAFSASVDHGAELCEAFNAAGHNFQQISYKDANDDRRRELIAEFRKPDSTITGLVACEVFTKGFDVPDVLCGIAARPYRKSFSSHIQQIGRVMRTSPGKEFALWLDHGGNIMRFWQDQQELFANGVQSLQDGALDKKARKEPEKKDEGRLCCARCKFVLPASATVCPACGHERSRKSMVETEAGIMVSIDGMKKPAAGKYEFLGDPKRVWKQLVYLAKERKGDDLAGAQRFAQAQYRNIYGEFARRTIENTAPEPTSKELRNLVQHNIIRWARSKVAA